MWIRNLLDTLRSWRSHTPAHKARRNEQLRRPTSCRLGVEALEDRAVPASLSIGDVTVMEGVSGSPNALVIVSLSAPSTKTVTVNYKTADLTALAGSDYDAVSGKLTFAPGETSTSILVPVRGDRVVESNEGFFVNLQGARGAKIADGQGAVTILDSRPRLSISDANVWEGGSGTTLMTFTVSLAAAYDETVTVTFATQDGSVDWYGGQDSAACAGQDYLATSGTLTFGPGETSKTVTVEIIGDIYSEFNEAFILNLSGASGNALIIDGEGIGSIMDDWGNFGWGDYGDPYTTY